MEQSILENSKGATYMSFILDIEIVIKKDGARVNLAETKTKSQVSKKQDDNSKEPYASSRNQDVKVYAASEQPRKSIFELPMGDDDESNFKESSISPNAELDPYIKTKDKSLSKNDSKVSKITPNQEKIPANIIFQESTEAPNNFENTSNSLKENVKPKKKKITKAEKKAKVFKGKIEPIDFLECNRIFMCNYFKIPISRNKRNFEINDRSSDSKVISTNENSSKAIGIDRKSISAQKLDKRIFKTPRLHRFWKKNPSFVVNKDSMLNRYSSGDCDASSTAYTARNEFEISQHSTTEISNSKTPESKNLMKEQHLTSELKFTECKINSLLRRNDDSLDTGDSQNGSTVYSYKHEKPDRKSNISRKSQSVPKIKENVNFKMVDSAKSDINQNLHHKNRNKTNFPFTKVFKKKTCTTPCTEKLEGFVGLKINCFDQLDYVLSTQYNIESGSTGTNNSSGDDTYNLKENRLPDIERLSNENFKRSGEIFNETGKTPYEADTEKDNEKLSTLKDNPPVLEKSASSNSCNTAGNKEQCPSIQHWVSRDTLLNSKTYRGCAINQQINIPSPELEDNCLTGIKCKLGGNGSEAHFENKELKANISDENSNKTKPTLSSKRSFGVVEICNVQSSQTKTDEQNTDNTEKIRKQCTKPKTPKLKVLHSYLKIVTNKLKK